MPVRTQKLVSFHAVTAGESPHFVCPDGYIVLVKAAHVQNAATVAGNFFVQLTDGQKAFTMNLLKESVPASSTAAWDGWAVLNPGDEVFAYLGADNSYIWISGSILAGPPQFPSA